MTSRDWLILIASVSLLASCWLSLVGTYAALRMNRAAKRLAISNGRTLHEQIYDAAGVTCWHLPGLDREDCACNGKGDL